MLAQDTRTWAQLDHGREDEPHRRAKFLQSSFISDARTPGHCSRKRVSNHHDVK